MPVRRLPRMGLIVPLSLVIVARAAYAADEEAKGLDIDWRWILLAIGIVIVVTVAIRVGQGIALRQADRKIVGTSRARLRRGHGGDQAPEAKHTER